MANVVLVTDMVVGFMEDGHNLYCGDAAREIIPNVQRLIESEQAAGGSVVFICDTHDPDDLEFEMFPVHCVRGTDEPDIIPELSGYEGIHLTKRRYSAFFETNLAGILAELQPERVIVCGVCTDICVMHTVADARNRDYAVDVPLDCVASFDEQAHANALEHMEKILGARLVGAPQ
ncbi:MAG: cysteine hydrolase [Chloroflexota bacterium]|nr:cysteine hydrolase [Chloroflexota bacterium]